MVTRWGMGALGPMALSADETQPFLGYELTQGRDYSEETAARIDKDVQSLLENRLQAVHDLLFGERDKLDLLAQALLHEETLDQADIARILGPRPLGVAEEANITQTISV
jgi:cell division protease FtsH